MINNKYISRVLDIANEHELAVYPIYYGNEMIGHKACIRNGISVLFSSIEDSRDRAIMNIEIRSKEWLEDQDMLPALRNLSSSQGDE